MESRIQSYVENVQRSLRTRRNIWLKVQFATKLVARQPYRLPLDSSRREYRRHNCFKSTRTYACIREVLCRGMVFAGTGLLDDVNVTYVLLAETRVSDRNKETSGN